MEKSVQLEPCLNCGEPCRLPPITVPFSIESVYCSGVCRSKHEQRKMRDEP